MIKETVSISYSLCGPGGSFLLLEMKPKTLSIVLGILIWYKFDEQISAVDLKCGWPSAVFGRNAVLLEYHIRFYEILWNKNEKQNIHFKSKF